jgi:hypothetical protein
MYIDVSEELAVCTFYTEDSGSSRRLVLYAKLHGVTYQKKVINFLELFYVCVCIRGGPLGPLHRDPQWSIVLNFYIL